MTHDNHKAQLEAELEAVTGELKTIGIHNPQNEADWIATPSVGSDEPDENDVADNAEDWGERAATLALLETKWNDVRRALAKIEAGTYGICEISGEPIEEARLEANPAARTCVIHREEESTLPR